MTTLLIVFGGLLGLPMLAGVLAGLNDRAETDPEPAVVEA